MKYKGKNVENIKLDFSAFANDQLVRLPLDKSRELFDEMVESTSEYLKEYIHWYMTVCLYIN